jgi:excisionase family DNA binding protein
MATPGAIAKSLGIPRSTLELAMRRRELTYIVPNRRVRLLRLADVERWLASCTVPADPIAGAS